MNTLYWHNKGWTDRNFIFSLGKEIFGEMTFYSFFNFNARFWNQRLSLHFKEIGFWTKRILIKRDHKILGEIRPRFSSGAVLKLKSGEIYTLTSNIWGRNVKWLKGNQVVLAYTQATLRSMGKGTIAVNDELNNEIRDILMSSGLYVRQLATKRFILLMLILLPITVAQ